MVLGPATIVAIVAFAAYASVRDTSEQEAVVSHTYQVALELDRLLASVTDAETGQRGFLITGDERYLLPYNGAHDSALTSLDRVRALTRDNPVQQSRLDSIGRRMEDKFSELNATIALRRSEGYASARNMVETDRGQRDMEAIRRFSNAMRQSESMLLDSRSRAVIRNRRTTIATIFGGAIAAILVSVLAYGVLDSLIDRRDDALEKLRIQSHELEEKSRLLEENAAELEASAEELEASNEQLQSSTLELEMANDELQQNAVERERLLVEADDARRAAEEANRAKSDFLAAMSHELRTPLNAIAGYAELLQLGVRGPVTAQQQEDLGRIQRSGRHLLGMISNILNFAKLEAGHIEVTIDDVTLDGALVDVDALIAPQVQAKGLVYVRKPTDRSVVVRADREKLQQIVLNLLSNAIKFTPTGGSISLETKVDTQNALIVVRDTGRGIPADKLEAIFEPFVQLDAGRTRTSEGAGLGLAISRDLARAMHGELVADGPAESGASFTLTLPLSSTTRTVPKPATP